MDENGYLKFQEWRRYAEEDLTVAKLVLEENRRELERGGKV